MTCEQWATHLIHAVCRAARGHPERLQQLAQRLSDAEVAREALICAGIGSDSDGLLELVAVVVERESLRSEEIIGLG